MNPSAVLLEENSEIADAIERIQANAQTPVVVSMDGQLVAAIGLQDTVTRRCQNRGRVIAERWA